jgi:hypothetical protein
LDASPKATSTTLLHSCKSEEALNASLPIFTNPADKPAKLNALMALLSPEADLEKDFVSLLPNLLACASRELIFCFTLSMAVSNCFVSAVIITTNFSNVISHHLRFLRAWHYGPLPQTLTVL